MLDENLNNLRIKRAFKMKENTFFIILSGLSSNQIKLAFTIDGSWLFIVNERQCKLSEEQLEDK